MEYLIGIILAAAVAGSAVIIGFDRERSFYATALIVIATYYVLFAVQGAYFNKIRFVSDHFFRASITGH